MKARKRAGTVGKVLGCALLLVIALFPIYWLVAMAIRPTSEMQGHISLIPQSLTIEHFISLFVSKGFGQAAINSLQTTLSSLVLSLIVGICAAYILARRRFRFGLKRPMTYWVLLVRVLPPVAFTIPLYTMFSKIGLLNTKIPVTLAANLRAVLAGAEPQPYSPQANTLNLLACGEKYAIASWGGWSAQGKWVWWLKDRIDRGFIQKYSGLAAK